MSLVWPPTLPQVFPSKGWDEAFPNTALASQPDMGPAKVRQRFTAAPRPWSFTLRLTLAQVDTLDTFYTATTAGGTLPFDAPHPRLGTREVQFLAGSPPKVVPVVGSLLWEATLSLEILP